MLCIFSCRALAKFHEMDFEGIQEHLDLIPGASEGGIPIPILPWDPDHINLTADQQFLRSVTLLNIEDGSQRLVWFTLWLHHTYHSTIYHMK